MGRSPCCEKLGLKKGPWTPEEDQKLLSYIEEHGHGCWRALPGKAGLQRCGKSCRLRWTNYLRPDIKRGRFSAEEEQTIIQLHALLGNRWSAIASHLPKRTDNEIKNFWNTHLKKRLAKMGIDPVTHKPRCDALSTADTHASKTASNLSHMAQWESARLEAEARLVRESKLPRFASSTSQLAATDHDGAAGSASSTTPPFQLPPLSSAASLPVELHDALPVGSSSANALPPCFDVLGAPWEGVRITKVTGPIRELGQGRSDVKIDLESPTSTLSFSESFLTAGAIGLANHGKYSCSAGRQHAGQILDGDYGEGEGRRGEETEGDQEVEWKSCFPKAMQLLDMTRDRSESFVAADFTTVDVDDSSTPPFGAADHSVSYSWLHESTTLKTGPAAASAAAASAVGHFGDGFTEMLLNNSVVDEHNSPGGAGSRKGNGGEDEEEEEEKYKNYWNSIFNLVSSVPASNPSDCVLV